MFVCLFLIKVGPGYFSWILCTLRNESVMATFHQERLWSSYLCLNICILHSKMDKCGGCTPILGLDRTQGSDIPIPSHPIPGSLELPPKAELGPPLWVSPCQTGFSPSWLFTQLLRLFRQPQKTHTSNLDCFHPFFERSWRTTQKNGSDLRRQLMSQSVTQFRAKENSNEPKEAIQKRTFACTPFLTPTITESLIQIKYWIAD